MSAIRNIFSTSGQLLRRKPLLFKEAGESARAYHIACAPVRNRVPSGEMAAMSVLLAVSMWFTPAWIIYHIPDYQNEDRHTYTGK